VQDKPNSERQTVAYFCSYAESRSTKVLTGVRGGAGGSREGEEMAAGVDMIKVHCVCKEHNESH
jgi:hypothetical protein